MSAAAFRDMKPSVKIDQELNGLGAGLALLFLLSFYWTHQGLQNEEASKGVNHHVPTTPATDARSVFCST